MNEVLPIREMRQSGWMVCPISQGWRVTKPDL